MSIISPIQENGFLKLPRSPFPSFCRDVPSTPHFKEEGEEKNLDLLARQSLMQQQNKKVELQREMQAIAREKQGLRQAIFGTKAKLGKTNAELKDAQNLCFIFSCQCEGKEGDLNTGEVAPQDLEKEQALIKELKKDLADAELEKTQLQNLGGQLIAELGNQCKLLGELIGGFENKQQELYEIEMRLANERGSLNAARPFADLAESVSETAQCQGKFRCFPNPSVHYSAPAPLLFSESKTRFKSLTPEQQNLYKELESRRLALEGCLLSMQEKNESFQKGSKAIRLEIKRFYRELEDLIKAINETRNNLELSKEWLRIFLYREDALDLEEQQPADQLPSQFDEQAREEYKELKTAVNRFSEELQNLCAKHQDLVEKLTRKQEILQEKETKLKRERIASAQQQQGLRNEICLLEEAFRLSRHDPENGD